MNAPCKDCTDRAPRCHGRCPKYAAFKAAKEAENARMREEYEAENTVIKSKLRMLYVSNHGRRR